MTAEKAKREWITKIIRGFSTKKKGIVKYLVVKIFITQFLPLCMPAGET